jgi:hypothetical protein
MVQDGVHPNSPESNLGGHDLLGDHPAKVHAEVTAAADPTHSRLAVSNTLQIRCVAP